MLKQAGALTGTAPAPGAEGPPGPSPTRETAEPERFPPGSLETEERERLLRAVCAEAGNLLTASAQRPRRMRLELGADVAVELEWPEPTAAAAPSAAAPSAAAPSDPSDPSVTEPERESPAPARPTGEQVCAPMVGTFYHAPKPGAPPFVTVGTAVRPGTQVGVLEAMKLMLPVEAASAGVVAEVIVPDGAPVEFGQPLVALAPAD